MTANNLELKPAIEISLETGSKVESPGSRGSVTFPQAEAMAVVRFGERSAAAIAQVLTDEGLGIR